MALLRSSRVVFQTLERISLRSGFSTHSTRCLALKAAVVSRSKSRAPPQITYRQFTRLPDEQPGTGDAPSGTPSGIPPPKIYNFQEISDLVTDPSPNRILIDVREPTELMQTGRIPTAKSIPISSAPDAFFMSAEDFEAKFGFPRPGDKDEVIFYCKAGVRSRQAALLAGQARPMFGGTIANYNGSWVDWAQNGGKVEREGEQGE